MKKSTNISFLLNEPVYDKTGSPKLLRIEFNPKFTKVDFGYQATSYYVKGGWVRMSADTFIRNNETGERFTLTNAINIPIAPQQHHFDTSKDWLYYSLIFPPIDIKNGTIDLLEEEFGESTDFNYYNIQINQKDLIPIKSTN